MARERKIIIRGNSKTFKVTVLDANQTPVDLTGALITFSVKSSTKAHQYIFQKKSTDPAQVEITDPINGVFKVYIVPDDTKHLNASDYVADAEIILNTGKKYTAFIITLVIEAEVTRDDL